MQAFSSCSQWGLLFFVVRGLLLVVASLVAECRLQGTRASAVAALRLWSTNSVVVVRGLSGPMCDMGSSWTRIGSHVLCIGRWDSEPLDH